MDARKQKKLKQRSKKLQQDKLFKEEKKNQGVTKKASRFGTLQLTLMGVLIALATGFIFYNMN
jgi:hypothetical protein